MRFGLIFSVLSVVACGDATVKTVNATPEAYITSHATGDTVDDGSTETVIGQVADADHALSELATAWLYNGDPVCPDAAPDDSGAVTCDVTFTTDGGDVTLTVRDPSGETATARVSLDVQETDAPIAELTSPVADGVYYSDQTLAFQGTVSDAEDDPEDLTVTFETDALGDLGLDITVTSEGEVEAFGMLDEGEHAVRLAVTDTSGKQSIDSALIKVGPPNSAPTCAITAPEDLSAGSEGELVIFSATVTDADIPANMLSVEWASDKDGPIGTSTPDSEGNVSFPYEGLTVNTHVISMTATDELGANCAANVIYSVGTPPVLNVTAPADGVTLNHSDAVVFEATVTDNEDLPNEVALSWESDIDGVFSTDGADSSGAATVSIATLSAGDHVVTVTATDTDGLFVTDTVSFNLNQPPTVPTVTLEPDPAATNQMLVATASGSVDPEGTGTVTYAYEWFEDGVASAESASATFPASATGKSHTYRVQVTASDGLVESAFGYAEVNVINSAPALVGPTLSAATVTVGDVLTCTASATDIDPEDTPTVTYVWSDASTGPTYTVTMTDAVDSTITCTATADDADGGVVTGTASATVTNTAPTVDTVTVSPATGQVGDELTCTATASDADGTTPDITYAWTDGSTGPTYTITADDAVDATITCTATATDVYDATGVGTASATVTNTAPVLDTVTISPATGQVGDVLTCTATASDADGTTPDITYAWSDGSIGPTYTITADDGVDATITCTATATDVYDATGVGTASATVTNTAPVMGTVSISPDPAYNTDTLVCAATATDADGTAPDITYEWTGGATTAELPLTSIIAASGDTLTCTATATDAYDETDIGTATITLGNRAPSVTATITPEDPRRTDTLTCTATDLTDPDDDATAVAFAWTVDGVDAAATSSDTVSTLDDAIAFSDDVVCTVTVTDGKDGSGSSTATVTVGNTAPVVAGATIVPSEVYTVDTVSAVATATDADDDSLTLTYAFSVDGTVVQDGPDSTLDGTVHFDKGQTLTVTVTASDGIAEGSDPSGSVVVRNTPPSPASASISPDEPTAGKDDLRCSITPATDADGDALTYTIAWTVDGTAFTDTLTTDRPGDTVSADDTSGDEEWTCTVVPNDGDAEGPSASASVTVQECFKGWDDTEVDLADANYTFVGEESGDVLARVADSGDVDGDGIPDLLMGSMAIDEGGTDAGKAYLVLGSSLRTEGSMSISDADYSFTGEAANDYIGFSYSMAFADVDGDGLDDILLAAVNHDDGSTDNGAVYIILGSSLGGSGSINLSDADYKFKGESSNDGAGRSVASAGDVDGDGLDDIIIGAVGDDDGGSDAGAAYILLGSSLDSMGESLSSSDYKLVGEIFKGQAGYSTSSAGDVDGDGLDDVIVGAYMAREDTDTCRECGAAYIVLGSSLGSTRSINLSAADYRIGGSGTPNYEQLGTMVSSAGDIDGDGLDDVIVGAPYYSIHQGRAYVILGSSLGSSTELTAASDADHIITSTYARDDAIGNHVSSAGDLNGDGYDDILVGGPRNFGNHFYVFFGPLDSRTLSKDEADYSFEGLSPGDYVGQASSAASVGDLNGDGLDDLLIGAGGVDGDDGTDQGTVYLLLAPNACNTPPRGTEVSISPSSPEAGEDDLVCTIDTEAYDAEGDTISYTFEWTVDGTSYSGSTATSETGDTVPGSATSEGEEWTCTVTPDDGADEGASVSTSVTPQSCFEGWDDTTVNLSVSDSDMKFNGQLHKDYVGKHVATAGDVDGDGRPDLLIQAAGSWTLGGAAYLVPASDLTGSSPMTLVDDARYAFRPDLEHYGASACCHFNGAMAATGDVDGDGQSDILIGSSGWDAGAGEDNTGRAHLYLADNLGSSGDLDESDADYTFNAEGESDGAGRWAAGKDIDGDGLSDIFISASNIHIDGTGEGTVGAVYVVLSSSLGSSTDFNLADADYRITGDTAQAVGNAISLTGDVDGDGTNDVLIAAKNTDLDAPDDNKGAVYLISGTSFGSDSDIDLADAEYKFEGEYKQAGHVASLVDDVDGDDLADVLIGTNLGGRAYMVLSSSLDGSSTIDLGDADYQFTGTSAGDLTAGYAASGAGDVDGDGLGDILIGEYRADSGHHASGTTYLLLGASLGSASEIALTSEADYKFQGIEWGGLSGQSVAGVGDIDGNGLDDILIGAPHEDAGDSDPNHDAGAAYLFLSPSTCSD